MCNSQLVKILANKFEIDFDYVKKEHFIKHNSLLRLRPHPPEKFKNAALFIRLVPSTLIRHENAALFLPPVWPSVHTNPSRKRSFSKTPFKPEEFENARRLCVLVWTENIFGNEAFRKRCRCDNHVISLTESVSSNTNSNWPDFRRVKPPFLNPSGVVWPGPCLLNSHLSLPGSLSRIEFIVISGMPNASKHSWWWFLWWGRIPSFLNVKQEN